MKTNNNRLLRVGENIRSVLAKHIMLNEVYIEELHNIIVTITEVQPSKDLRYAKVFVSAVGEDETRVAKILNNFSKPFSKLVAKEINTKYSPKLHFLADLSFDKANKINKLFKKNGT
ncbi:30S ribosome-binding factor RbfA [Alphaproteobacteria bacterium]|nr:30S ribosome-binding factor RbfA [Alphaproteobacteria bacterium]